MSGTAPAPPLPALARRGLGRGVLISRARTRGSPHPVFSPSLPPHALVPRGPPIGRRGRRAEGTYRAFIRIPASAAGATALRLRVPAPRQRNGVNEMNKTRSPLTAIAIVLASTTALVAVSDIAAARGGGGGHQETSRQMNAQGNRQVAMSTPSRDMTSKPPVYRDKGSRNDSAHAKKHKGCGKLIVPTAGCPTPARDPVGNTRPSLPTEAKQPTDKSRLPVLEYVKTLGPQSTNQPANAPAHPAVAPASGVAVSNGVT